jgi:hypothetical protein
MSDDRWWCVGEETATVDLNSIPSGKTVKPSGFQGGALPQLTPEDLQKLTVNVKPAKNYPPSGPGSAKELIYDAPNNPYAFAANPGLAALTSEVEATEKFRPATDVAKRYARATGGMAPANVNMSAIIPSSVDPDKPIHTEAEWRKYISALEGLEIGKRKKDDLSRQWLFILSSEPFQRGMDAGLVTGTLSAVVSNYWPKNRNILKTLCVFCGGFCIGMIGLPIYLLALELRNEQRVQNKDREFSKKNREEYLANLVKAED